MPTLVLPQQAMPAIVEQAQEWMQSASGGDGAEASHVSKLAKEALTHWSERAEILLALADSDEDTAYNHLLPKIHFVARVRYKFVGKLPPRRFPIDD